MQKYPTLRCFLRRFKNVPADHILKDCPLVIDGDSYFHRSYKESGCKFILGGECDRYAYYLKKTLKYFIKSNVTCYVIFNGCIKGDIGKRAKIHQKLIDDKIDITPDDGKYYEPVFTKEIQKQVLEELGIRYFVCDYDARETLLDVSKTYGCPVLTNNIENCVLGMACITPDTLTYVKKKNHISCKIHTPEAYSRYFEVISPVLPVFMSILDENGPLFEKLPEILGPTRPGVNPVGYLLSWFRRNKLKAIVIDLTDKLSTESELNSFFDCRKNFYKLIYNSRDGYAVSYFKSDQNTVPDRNKRYIKKGVDAGRIPIPYINLKNGTFFGSWVIYDQNKRDAMQPAMDIVMFAAGFFSYHKRVTFIHRDSDKTHFEQLESMEVFQKLIGETMIDFDWSLLKDAPEESWLLILTLLYYLLHDREFILAAYSILLSYVMLDPVSEQVGLMKRSKLLSLSFDASEHEDEKECVYKDCLTACEAMIEYFYQSDVKKTFDRSLLHSLTEFQHCLQQMNYLNKLCGEKVKCTNYYKTYNGTFVFNVLIGLREHKNPMGFIETQLKNSPSVLKVYQTICKVFDNFVQSLKDKSLRRPCQILTFFLPISR